MNTANVKYNRETQLLGLLGYPLGHSAVPGIHNRLYHFAGINAVLLPMELEDTPGNLDRFFEAVRTLRIRGLIVTMPYKTRMLPYMDEISEVCRVLNCVNAVKYVDGRFYGEAFDGFGMCQAIEDSGCALASKEVLMIGAGGVSGVVAWEMARRGVAVFTILNRTPEKAERLAAILKEHTGTHVHAGPLTETELERAARCADVVVQCTSAGMYGTGTAFPYVDFMNKLKKTAVVADVLYNPPRIAFLEAAVQNGLQVVNGVGMLSNQANLLIDFFFHVDLGPEGKAEAVRAITCQSPAEAKATADGVPKTRRKGVSKEDAEALKT